MSTVQLYSVLGDQNVVQNMTTLNMASREVMKASQVISCPSLQDFESVPSKIRDDATVCLYAAITDHILSSPEQNTIYSTIGPVFTKV